MTDRHSAFTSVTEMPGHGSTAESLSMLVTRYTLAAELAAGRDVLDIACGPGMGLGMVAATAKSVVAGDYDPDMVAQAAATYGDRLTIRRLDAMDLDFLAESFDLVLIMESLYFMPDPKQVIRNAATVLRPGGKLLVVSANSEWTNFNPAPFSTRYLTLSEIAKEMETNGLTPDCRVGYEEQKKSLKGRILSGIRKFAVKMNLIPKTMGGKELLKRLMHGTLIPLPAELKPTDAEAHMPEPVAPTFQPVRHKVITIIGTKP